MTRAVRAGGALLAAAFGLFAFHSLLARAQWERDRTVEICVDGEEVRSLSDADDDRTHESLAVLAEHGVSGVAVYWDPSYTVASVLGEWRPRIPEGMTVTLRPEAAPFSDWRRHWPRAARLGRATFPPVVHALFSGPSVLGFPEMATVERWVASSSLTLPWVEFSRQRGTARLLSLFPGRVIRAHTLTEDEMAQSGPALVQARYLRAVRERGARFLYVRFFPGFSSEENLSSVVRLADALRAEGYALGTAAPRHGDFPSPLWPMPVLLRQSVALLFALGGPLAGLVWVSRRRTDAFAALRLTGVTLATAAVVAALLSAPEFVLGFSGFRGVKLALLAPLAAALFFFYRAKEIRHFLHEPINVERLVLGGLVLGAAAYYLSRSGNTAVDPTGMELELRGALERFLGVRPRFKEFLIGHPLLILGFYLRRRFAEGVSPFPDRPGAVAQAMHFLFHDPRPFLLIGFIGQLSLINTFCHAHTPLWVSALRTFHGLWIGGALGAAAVLVFRGVYARWPAAPRS